MGGSTWTPLVAIVGILYVVFVFSFGYKAVGNSDNQTSITNASRNAMTESVNLGSAKFNEELTINEEVAIESAIRMYAASADFSDGARYVNIKDVKSDPAMIATESYLEVNTPLRPMLKFFNHNIDVVPDYTRSREIVIYEAKEINRK